LNRPVSTRVSTLLAPFGIPPDMLSVLSAAVGWLGAVWLAHGGAIAGAVAVHASSVLDGVDGEVARLRLRESPRGALLDGILDRLTDAAIIGALGLWAIRSATAPSTVVVLAVAAAALAVLSMASKDRIEALALLPAPERLLGWLLGGRDGRLLLVAIFSALGRPVFALGAVVAASGVTLALRVLYVLRQSG
jgi:phosphatidylglycerophosphate synthase